MSSESALLQQIQANPADDQLRAVYADLLQGRGEPRGELIALDLELARDRRPELFARKAALLAEYGPKWWPQIPVSHIDVRRGFVERVAGYPQQLQRAAAMFEQEPIERVELYEAYRISKHAWQQRIRALAVRGRLGTHDLDALSEQPLAEWLVELDLGGALHDARKLAAGAFPRVRRLSLADNHYLGHSWHALLDWPMLGVIETLDLRRCRFDARALMAIVPALANVRVLRLSGNPIGPDGVHPLARVLAEMTRLQVLDVIGTGIGADGVRALAEALPGIQVATQIPSELVLDLVGTELAFVHRCNASWSIVRDGAPCRIEVTHSTRYDTDPKGRVTHADSGLAVPLDALVRALAEGAVRELASDHASITLGTQTGAVYNTSVWSTQTAKIALAAKAVEITFEEYVDTRD